MLRVSRRAILALPGAAALGAPPAAAIRPESLRCEWLAEPRGVDRAAPGLSWRCAATRPGARGLGQSAWQVRVGSAPAVLAAGHGDLWDSGTVESDRMDTTYAGRPLRSGERCIWAVRVWDQDGVASPWSAPAQWDMGLLAPEDWRGRWIGLDEPERPAVLEAGWIWFPEGRPEQAAPPAARWFRRDLVLDPAREVVSATLDVAADDEAELVLNGRALGQTYGFQAAVRLDVRDLLRPGANVLSIAARNAGAAPNPAGVAARLTVTFAAGPPFVVTTDATWQAAQAPAGPFVPALVLGPAGMAPWGPVRLEADRPLPARWLRREFATTGPVRRAVLHASGLGWSELSINGWRVGDALLSPGLTDYARRVPYVTHDVTHLLRPGANAIGVVLGNGRFHAPRAHGRSYGAPRLLLQLRIAYADGGVDEVVSDARWSVSADGPIRANNEYDGEEYDARREFPGWDRPGFDAAQWRDVDIMTPPGGRLAAEMLVPTRIVGLRRPVAARPIAAGVRVLDFGQNFAGFCRLRVRGPRGTRIVLRHAERVHADGTLDAANLRSARATDSYTLSGEGEEIWQPRFTLHGFRYVEVRGFPGDMGPDAIIGCVVSDDLEPTGTFACSDPLLERIWRAAVWTVRSNMRSIRTDCPQRDERQGWLGDAAECSRGEAFMFDNAALYRKWLDDMADSQRPDGALPDLAPAYWPIYNDDVAWPAAACCITGMLLDQYADATAVARHYPFLAGWAAHMEAYVQDGVLARDSYGDWCPPPADRTAARATEPWLQTDGALIATAMFGHCLDLLARFARLLGREDAAARHRALGARLTAGLNARWPAADGRYGPSATASILPLAFGMVPAAQRGAVMRDLVAAIARGGGHVCYGMVGGQWALRVLARNGAAELAGRIALQAEYPGFGHMLARGATTLWELWNGDTAPPGMNSANHVMQMGDLVTWMFEDLAGLRADPQAPGFAHVLVRPVPLAALSHAKASYRSRAGLVEAGWARTGAGLTLSLTVPPNARATVQMPGQGTVREAGGFQGVRRAGPRSFITGSGTYQFTTA